MKTSYTASMDNFTKGMTLLVFVIIIGASIIPTVLNISKLDPDTGAYYVSAGVAIFVILLMGGVYLFKIIRYELTDSELIIVRPYKSVHIPLDTITGVTKLDKSDLFPGTVRTFGNGGFFGYTGMFWNKTHGSMTFYLTRRDKLIMIESISSKKNKNTKIVISPDDLSLEDKMISLLKDIKR